jgi:hypothetical protein
MGNRSTTFAKRQRETAQKEKAKAKEDRRAERIKNKETTSASGDEDPDIAGIVPGPQPPIEDL